MKAQLLPMLAALLVALLVAPVCAAETPAPSNGFDYARWARILADYRSTDGRQVNYAALKAAREELVDPFYGQLAQFSPDSHPEKFPTRNDRIAYWLNAYNFLVIYGVIENYPIESVLDVKLFHGFFRRIEYTLGGKPHTLKQIEDALRRADPRIHFALNCASRSCPALRAEPFRGEALDEQLERAARNFIASDRGIQIDRGHGKIYLSKIFGWYKADFERWLEQNGHPDKGLLGYIAVYAPEKTAALLGSPQARAMDIEFMDYDWRLNDAGAS